MDAEIIRRELGALADKIELEVADTCDSTNRALLARAAELPAWYVLLADRQSDGRGRMGRSFYSPAGSGLYMSVLLRPGFSSAEDVPLITPAAAVAVCRAAEELGAGQTQIKWVNDVLLNGKKVCGILTEAAFTPRSGRLAHAVLGVGVNVRSPAGGFPPELESIAGALFPAGRGDMREAMAAAFLRQLYPLYEALPDRAFVAEYRERSCLVGRRVNVLGPDGARAALALGIDERCRLLVRYDDGSEDALFSGDVSVRAV